MPIQQNVALVVVDHGSRSEASNASLDEVAGQIATLSGDRFVVVLAAHMDLAAPTIADAFDSAVAAGATFVLVALYFLASGRHSDTDVPRLAAAAASRHPGLAFAITDSLGPDAALSALVLDRSLETLSRRHF